MDEESRLNLVDDLTDLFTRVCVDNVPLHERLELPSLGKSNNQATELIIWISKLQGEAVFDVHGAAAECSFLAVEALKAPMNGQKHCLAFKASMDEKEKATPTSYIVLIGLLLVILVIAQIIMGYLHHLAYKRGRGASIFTSVHRVLGRSLILGGCVNAFLGLRLVSFTRLTFVVFASVSLIDLLIMAALWYISSKDGRPTETTDEDKTPFLDEPETT